MKRINRIIIENFKFFYGKEELNFNRKNILIYGENGSGKSSLYWALYTFLQSAMKNDDEIRKYFNKEKEENLKNIYNLDKDSSIEIEIHDDNKIKQSFKISKNLINTNKKDTQILKSNFTSDFINYKLLSKIYDFKHSQDIDLWNFFYDYVLEFIPYSNEFATLKDFWKFLKKGLSKNNNRYPTIKSSIYKEFQQKISDFNTAIQSLLTEIKYNSNYILQENFNENIKIEFNYKNATYNDFIPNTKKRNHKTLPPKILLNVRFFEKDLSKPHSFLNEARLTSIALSIRFAILKNRLVSEDVLKILVLDDLLISLDMSKRFEVIDFILNDDDLQNYQKIILTHDKSFFEILKYKLNKLEWKIFEFYTKKEDTLEKQDIKEYKDNLSKAINMFEKKEYELSANLLRKEVEEILYKFLSPNLEFINKDFKNLENLIKEAKNKLENEFLKEFHKIFKFFNSEDEIIYSKNLLEKIDEDFENDNNLDPNEKGKLRGLKRKIFNFTKKYYEFKIKEMEIFNELKLIKDRIFNPASHYNRSVPFYKKELEEGIKLIEKLKKELMSKK